MKFHSNKFIRWFAPLAICLIALLVTLNYLGLIEPIKRSNSISPIKKEHWQTMEKRVAMWGDALGLGIDPGIKKMVIVLNLLGFKTEQSCEGHADWGRPYPWVSINTQTPELQERLATESKRISTLIGEKETEIHKKYPDLSLGAALRKEEVSPELKDLYKKRIALFDEEQKASRLVLAPLHNLLGTFYAKHAINPDTMLALSGVIETFELSSLGGNWQVMRDEKERLQKLHAYQKEMKAFADFLTDYYFKKESLPQAIQP